MEKKENREKLFLRLFFYEITKRKHPYPTKYSTDIGSGTTPAIGGWG